MDGLITKSVREFIKETIREMNKLTNQTWWNTDLCGSAAVSLYKTQLRSKLLHGAFMLPSSVQVREAEENLCAKYIRRWLEITKMASHLDMCRIKYVIQISEKE